MEHLLPNCTRTFVQRGKSKIEGFDFMEEIPQKIKWLDWAREIQSIAQIGNTYAENHFQRQRYDRLLEIAAEIVSKHTTLAVEPVLENFQLHTGYATPKVDVRGAVFKDGKILLVQEKLDGGWTLPGGWADVGDPPSASTEREVWEESGYKVKAQRLIGVYDANRKIPLDFNHAYKLVYICNILGGSAQTSDETSAVAFFGPDEIPKNFSGERTQERHIRDAFLVYEDPSSVVFID
jgi:ADP-ribose pyrophosphatase YjhB (NUDIX family)